MLMRPQQLLSLLKPHLPAAVAGTLHHQIQTRPITKVRLKWVKNRSIDHIIDKETDLKAACLLKDAIHRSTAGFLTSRSVADWQRTLGLTVPVLRFLRRYPTLFEQFPHPRYPSLPCFRLTDTALLLHSDEQSVHSAYESGAVERLSRLLMMCKSRSLPFQSLHPLKWDLGLPDDFDKSLIRKHPDQFRIVRGPNGLPVLTLARWNDDLAVSEHQRKGNSTEPKRGQIGLPFAMSFPRGYGGQKKVKAWMDEFQKLPYISPYEDSRGIDPNSELMEKRVVGVLHELLSLTIHKKTKRNYLRSLRDELNLPHRFTRLFTRYPGIFYLSLKCKTTTVTLREGYRRGRLVDPHPLARIRDKFYHVMKTGLLYRGKGLELLAKDGSLAVAGVDQEDEEGEEEGSEEEECWEEVSEEEEVGLDSDSGSD